MKVFQCKLCNKNIYDRDTAIQCDICQFWVHLRCNILNLVDYKYLQGSTDPWFCLSCCSTILPFGNLSDHDFSSPVLNKNYIEISNNALSCEVISRNIATTSDHLPQFLFASNVLSNPWNPIWIIEFYFRYSCTI